MTRRIAPVLVSAFAALALTAGPAVAKGGSGSGGGGGGGGGTTTPAPTPDPVFVDVCDGYWDLPAYPDGSLPLVNRTTGGCVIVKAGLNGLLTLDRVILVPGWTYTIESGGGTKGRVQLSFSNPATGQTASIRVEPGKTDIR